VSRSSSADAGLDDSGQGAPQGAPFCLTAGSLLLVRIAVLALLTCALGVAGCTPKPEPAAPAEEPAPPPPPTPRRPSVVPLRTAWSFTTNKDECVAIASSGVTALRVVVRHAAPIRLSVTVMPALAGDQPEVPLRFTGPAGNWRMSARRFAAHDVGLTLPADNPALSRVLALLSGGVLEVGASDRLIASLAIVPSETKGQLWFDCARLNIP
jgi:hypothetical protein